MTQTTAQSSNFWNALVAPHPSVKGAARGRARLLAGASLVLMVVASALVVWIGTFSTETVPFLIAAPVVYVICYALSRSQRAQWGAWLLVGGQLAITLVFIYFGGTSALAILAVPFLMLPVLLSMLLLDTRSTVIVSIVNVVSLIVLPILIPTAAFSDFIMQFGAVLVLSALACVISFFRERDFNAMQKQSDEMARYSHALETEARNMLATAQVGHAITATRDVGQLLRQIVDLIIERFADIYHAQVFLIDSEGQFAELRESTGEAGRQLMARGHKLQVGSQSVIGQVTAIGEARIVRDTDLDPVHRRNELLPNTRAEMALPLLAGGRVIGALDIQSTTPDIFGESEVRVFQTMADQLAVAIENARLFERAQRDLQEIEVLNRRLTGEGWQRFRQSRGLTGGVQADPMGIHPLPSGEPESASENALRMPLMVRGESVGMLDVTSRTGEPPSDDVQAILKAVAERVAQALDSTRLSESALYQAEREQVLSRLSAELQATTDLDVILKVAAREASRALGTTRGFVHLVMEYGERAESAESE